MRDNHRGNSFGIDFALDNKRVSYTLAFHHCNPIRGWYRKFPSKDMRNNDIQGIDCGNNA
jgi:hypothetical protein